MLKDDLQNISPDDLDGAMQDVVSGPRGHFLRLVTTKARMYPVLAEVLRVACDIRSTHGFRSHAFARIDGMTTMLLALIELGEAQDIED